jgi:tRNA threonylcarbamoyladenosine biosynthesis protein TsaB
MSHSDRRVILGLDCATAACSAAVLIGPQTAARLQEPMRHGQAERIVPMIAEALAAAGLCPAQLDGIAVTVGPGAFTGVRVGLSAALGLARAAGVPCAGVTVTEALAAGIAPEPGGRLIVALDSRRPDAPFLELFSAADGPDPVWQGEGPVAADPVSATALGRRLQAAEDGPVLLCGDAAGWMAGPLSEAGIEASIMQNGTAQDGTADPVQVARLGALALRAGTARPAQPLYLRAPDVSAPARDRARRPAG